MAPRSPPTPRLNVREFSISTQILYLVNREVEKQLKPLKANIKELEKYIEELEDAFFNLSQRFEMSKI